MLERGVEGGAEVVGMDDRGQEAELRGGSAIASIQDRYSRFCM